MTVCDNLPVKAYLDRAMKADSERGRRHGVRCPDSLRFLLKTGTVNLPGSRIGKAGARLTQKRRRNDWIGYGVRLDVMAQLDRAIVETALFG